MKRITSFIYTVFCVMTAMIGYHIHGSLFWSFMDFCFMPLTWCKWLVCAEVNLTIIRQTFEFFFK